MKEKIVKLPVPKHQKLWKDYLQEERNRASVDVDKLSKYRIKQNGVRQCKQLK